MEIRLGPLDEGEQQQQQQERFSLGPLDEDDDEERQPSAAPPAQRFSLGPVEEGEDALFNLNKAEQDPAIRERLMADSRRLDQAGVRDVSGLRSASSEFARSLTLWAPRVFMKLPAISLSEGKEEAMELIKGEDYANDPTANAFWRGAVKVEEWLRELFPVDPDMRESILMSAAPQIAGEIAKYGTAGALTGGPGAMVLGAADIGTMEYEHALRETGGDTEKALAAMAVNAPMGFLEGIMAGKILKRMNTVTNGGVVGVLTEGFRGSVQEAAQETFQGFWAVASGKAIYDDTRQFIPEMKEAAAAGGAAGFVMNAMAAAIPGTRRARSTGADAVNAHEARMSALEEAARASETGGVYTGPQEVVTVDPLSEGFYYHSPRSNEDISSILESGLWQGSNVGLTGESQSFASEVVLVFPKPGSRIQSKGYNPGEGVVEKGQPPIGIMVDRDAIDFAEEGTRITSSDQANQEMLNIAREVAAANNISEDVALDAIVDEGIVGKTTDFNITPEQLARVKRVERHLEELTGDRTPQPTWEEYVQRFEQYGLPVWSFSVTEEGSPTNVRLERQGQGQARIEPESEGAYAVKMRSGPTVYDTESKDYWEVAFNHDLASGDIESVGRIEGGVYAEHYHDKAAYEALAQGLDRRGTQFVPNSVWNTFRAFRKEQMRQITKEGEGPQYVRFDDKTRRAYAQFTKAVEANGLDVRETQEKLLDPQVSVLPEYQRYMPKKNPGKVLYGDGAVWTPPGKLRQNLRKWLGPSKGAPESAKKARERKVNRHARELTEVEQNQKRLYDKIKEVVADGELTEQQVFRRLDQAMRGKISFQDLPQPIQEPARRARIQQDRLSREAISSGLVQGDLAMKFHDQLGSYLHRTYRIFHEEDWNLKSGRIPEEVVNRAAAWLHKSHPEMNTEQLHGLVARVLDQAEAGEFGRVKWKDAKVNRAVFQDRKNIPGPIRALMGEYGDPVTNYALGVESLSKELTRWRMQVEVRKMGMEEGWLFESTDVPAEAPGEFNTALVKNAKEKGMEAWDGLTTHPDIAKAFEENDIGDAHPVTRWVLMGNMIAKSSVTVWSPRAQLRNPISGEIMLRTQGLNPSSKARKQAGRVVKANFTGKGDVDAQQELLRIKELGIVDQDVASGDLRKTIEDAGLGDLITEGLAESATKGTLRRRLAQYVAKASDKASQVYQNADNLIRLTMYYGEKQRYREALPDISEVELEELAAERTLQTYQNYAGIPERIKWISSRIPFGGMFLSYHYELMRTQSNTIRLIRQETKSDNPAIQKIGRERLAGLIGTWVAPRAIQFASQGMMGITDDLIEDAREFMAPWDKDGAYLFTSQAQDQELSYINLHYLFPQGALLDGVNVMLDDDRTVMEKTLANFGNLLGPIFEKEIFYGAVTEAIDNPDEKVYYDNDDIEDKWAKSVIHIGETLTPRAFRDLKRLGYAYRVFDPKDDKEYKKHQEILGIMGIRITDLNIKESLMFEGLRYAKGVQSARKRFNTVRGRKDATFDELWEAQAEAQRVYEKEHEAMSKKYEAAMRFPGMNYYHVEDALVNKANLSEELFDDLLIGRALPLIEGDKFIHPDLR